MADPKWKTRLVPNLSTITGSIFVTGTFLDLLISYGLIDMNQRARIDLAGIESDKATKLFEALVRCPPGSFDEFCRALDETSQGHLAKILRVKRGEGGKRSSEALRVSEQEHLPKRLRSSDKRTQETLSPSPPSNSFLYKLARSASHEWREIVLHLGFTSLEMEKANHRFGGDPEKLLAEFLFRWRKRKGKSSSIAALQTAFVKARLGLLFYNISMKVLGLSDFGFYPKALLTKGMIKVARVRINVIGQDGVGKTCLVKLLLGQEFEEQLSTCGIDMKNAVTMFQYHCSAEGGTSTEWKLFDQEEFRKKLQEFFQKSKPEKKEKKLSHSGPITETNSSQIDETDDEILGEEVSEISAAPQEDSLTSEQLGFIRNIVTDPSQDSGLNLDHNVILMRICDFGGQEPFLTAHASLMPAGSLSVYLLVFNGALPLTGKAESWHVTEGKGKIPQKLVRIKTNDDFLKQWSSSAHIAHPAEKHATFIGENEDVKYPAIFLVSTHRETSAVEVIEENNKHLKTLFQEKDIQSHFVNATSSDNPYMFFLVENKTSGTENEDPTASEIRTRVDAMTRNFYERQDFRPARWLKFEIVISLLKTITGRSVGKMSLIREVAQVCCIDTNGENSELERALKHLAHVGSVFYFPEVAALKDFVFHDANWLINLLASFVGSAHSEPDAPKLKSHWQKAIKSGFLSTDLVNSLLQLAKVSKDEYDAAKGILDYFDIITETKEGSEDKGYVSPCFLQGDFEGQSEYSKAFSSDRKVRHPPPLVLFVQDIVFFPESFFFRLVTRFLRRRRRVYDRLLRRNRIVFPVSSGVDAEFLYQSELNCATLTVFTKNSSLSSEELSKMTKECVSLRMSLAKDIEEAKRRGMAGLQCRLYCQVRERRDENLYDTLAETDDYDITEDVWILANGTGQLSCDERQGMGLWFGGGKRSADTILAMLATEAFFCYLAEQSQNDWQAIARKLGFGQAEIGAIENDFNGVKEQCIRMFCRWLDREGSVGTLAVLKEAYKNAKLIGQFETAVKEHF